MHVIINGVSSETLQGVQVLSLPPITKPRMRTSIATIDGRPGDVVTRLGYEAYNRKIQILLHHDYDIDAISAFFNTSGTIIFSNEPDMEYEFETIDAFSFERAVRYKTADITFHVQPYKLSATEEPATGEVSTLVDKTPYIFRRTPYGAREKGSIVGGSLVWNQLMQDVGIVANSGTSAWDATNKEYTITCTNLTSPSFGYYSRYYGVTPSHVVLISESLNPSSALTGVRFGIDATPIRSVTIPAGSYTQFDAVIKNTGTTSKPIISYHNLSQLGLSALTLKVKNLIAIDLTLMFGTEIADYIYTQEQATAGAGVALAKAWGRITEDYHPYDPGSIKSVTGLTAHKMTGFNQWDEEWENGAYSSGSGTKGTNANKVRNKNPIPILPNTEYYIETPLSGTNVYQYDADMNYIQKTVLEVAQGNTFTSLPNACYMNFSTFGSDYKVYNHDICINLSDPSKNGTYEPYDGHVYPLDSSLTLRGILKLDGDNFYYDGDVYNADGTVERRYRVVDLGTLNWSKDNQTNNPGRFYSSGIASLVRRPTAAVQYGAFILCSKYIAGRSPISTPRDAQGMIAIYTNGTIYLSDITYTESTTAEFKTAMSGVYLLYELEEPTTEQAEPYTALQICDPAGTEEWVGANMPVGHETTYIDPISMTVTNEGNTESAPSITIEGEGSVEVTVDGLNILQIQMLASGEITIDSKTLDATDGEGGLANRSVTGDYNDLRLTPGEHTVTVAGDVTSVTIKNASRWI